MHEAAPISETVEAWAEAYIRCDALSYKTAPPSPPPRWKVNPPNVNILSLGRPPELTVSLDKPKSVRLGALREPRARAKLLHKFWHHELQAAELMCWGLLRFADAEQDFRSGLLRICRDEIRHMRLYQSHIEALGFHIGSFAVRDWFWDRVPSSETPVQFVAMLGMGLEAANLEHTPRFAAWFRAVGDEAAARIQDQVGKEEVGHVHFATHWFRVWTGTDDFSVWRGSLPAPLSPMLMRGKTLNREARLKAGMSPEFLDRLEAFRP